MKEDGIILFNGKTFVEKTEETVSLKKWEPKGGPYYIRGVGDVVNGYNSDGTSRLYGSEFKTENLAKAAQKKVKATQWLIHLANELNGKWTPDWNDGTQTKFQISYDHVFDGFVKNPAYFLMPIGTPVFSEDAAEKICAMLTSGEIDKSVFY